MKNSRFVKYSAIVLPPQLIPMLALGFPYLFLVASKKNLPVDVIARLQQEDEQLHLARLGLVTAVSIILAKISAFLYFQF